MRLKVRAPLAVAALVFTGACVAQETAIDRYVAQKDSVYGWKLVRTVPGKGFQTHVLELTSQSWRTEKDVDRPVWKHWLTIVRPDNMRSNKALLFIGGGNNNDPAPSKASDRMLLIATETGTVAAELAMVPNQPLHFTDSPQKGRTEDDLTTWLVGAVDPRVEAIMPIVIDALNSEQITRHHFEAYGFFSSALKDYVEHGLFPLKIGTPEYQAVLRIEDPYNYRNRQQLR